MVIGRMADPVSFPTKSDNVPERDFDYGQKVRTLSLHCCCDQIHCIFGLHFSFKNGRLPMYLLVNWLGPDCVDAALCSKF